MPNKSGNAYGLTLLCPILPGLPRRQLMAELEQRIEAATAALEREAMAGYPAGGNQSSSPPLRIWSSE